MGDAKFMVFDGIASWTTTATAIRDKKLTITIATDVDTIHLFDLWMLALVDFVCLLQFGWVQFSGHSCCCCCIAMLKMSPHSGWPYTLYGEKCWCCWPSRRCRYSKYITYVLNWISSEHTQQSWSFFFFNIGHIKFLFYLNENNLTILGEFCCCCCFV